MSHKIQNTLASGEGKHYQLFHGNNIVPAGFENRSVRYFSTSKPLACAVEIIEYMTALHFVPFAILLNCQFLRPIVKALIAFSVQYYRLDHPRPQGMCTNISFH